METRLTLNGIFCVAYIILLRNGTCDEECCRTIGCGTIGYTRPRGDIQILLGSDLVINCTLKQLYHDSEDLYWLIRNTEANVSFVSALDNRTSQLRLPSSQFPNSEFMITCLTRNDNFTDDKRTVCNNMVFVLDMTTSNETMKCTSYDFNNISCEWTLPEEPNRFRSKWNLEYWKNAENLNCSCIDKKCLSWNCNYTGCDADRTIDFTLTAQNTFGKWTYNYTFDLLQNTILSGPVELKPGEIGNTTALITWDPYEECVGKIIKNKNNSTQIEFKTVIKRNNKEQLTYTLRNLDQRYNLLDLIPYSNYTVEIRLRLVIEGIETKHGSSSYVSFKTLAGVPAMPPNNLVGTLSDEGEASATSRLTLHWKAVPEDFQRGEAFEYLVTLSSADPTVKIQNRTDKTGVTFFGLQKNTEYTVEVKGVNEIGESIEASRFFIDDISSIDFNDLEIDDVILDDKEAKWKYTVSWKALGQTDDNLVHYWCQGKKSDDGIVHCNSSGINARQVESDTVTYNLDPPPDSENYFFGVAAKLSSKSVHLVWSSCTIPTSRPPLPPRNLIPRVSAKWVQLTWDPLSCEDKAVGIQGYQLHVNDSESASVYNVTGMELTAYNVTGLSSGVRYSMSLRTMTADAVSVENSLSVLTNSDKQPSSSEKGPSTLQSLNFVRCQIVLIVVPICIFLFALAGFGWWKYKRFQLKLKKITIDLPKKLMEDPTEPSSDSRQTTGAQNGEAPPSVDTNNSENMTITVNPLSEIEAEDPDSTYEETAQKRISQTDSEHRFLNVYHADDYTRVIHLNQTDLATTGLPDEQQLLREDVNEVEMNKATRSHYLPASNLRDIPYSGGNSKPLSPNADHRQLRSSRGSSDNDASDDNVQFSFSGSILQRLNSDHGLGYIIASSAADQSKNASTSRDKHQLNSSSSGVNHQLDKTPIPLNRQQLDLGCNSGYTKTSTAMDQYDTYLTPHGSSVGYSVAPIPTIQRYKPPAACNPQRLDRSYSAGYTTASLATDRCDKLIPHDKQLLDHCCKTGYSTVSTVKHQCDKFPTPSNRHRLDSGGSVGYIKASSAIHLPMDSPTPADQQTLDLDGSTGCSSASCSMGKSLGEMDAIRSVHCQNTLNAGKSLIPPRISCPNEDHQNASVPLDDFGQCRVDTLDADSYMNGFGAVESNI